MAGRSKSDLCVQESEVFSGAADSCPAYRGMEYPVIILMFFLLPGDPLKIGRRMRIGCLTECKMPQEREEKTFF